MDVRNKEAMEILAHAFNDSEMLAMLASDRQKTREYFALVKCRSNPRITSVETAEQYEARKVNEFWSLLLEA